MFKEYRYELSGYTIYCEKTENENGSGLVITRYKGGGSKLYIPDVMDADGEILPVIAVGKKAILGSIGLQHISLPISVTKLQDWAFAHCVNLKSFTIRGEKNEEHNVRDHIHDEKQVSQIIGKLSIGSGVFEGDLKIADIIIGAEEPSDLSALLASVIHRMKAEYLFRDNQVGESDWYAKWDQRLLMFLDEKDDDGYTELVLCGEEDGAMNEETFIRETRKRKSALCLLRLLHDTGLSEGARARFADYLLSHTKGAASEEAWLVILSDFSDNVDYYKLFADVGGINRGNIDDMIADMGENFAEAKAFLIRFKNEAFGDFDIFDSFEL